MYKRSVLLLSVLLASSVGYSQSKEQPVCSDYQVFDSLIDTLDCGFGYPSSPADIATVRRDGVKIGSMKRSIRGFESVDGLLSDILFTQQDSLSNSALDALLDWSVEIDFATANLDQDGDDSVDLRLPLRLNSHRGVYLNNLGIIKDGKSDSALASQYTVVSTLNMRLRPEVEGSIGGISAGIRGGDVGMNLRLIQQKSAPSKIVKKGEKDPSSAISPFLSPESQAALKQADPVKRTRLQKAFSAIGNGLARIFTPISGGISKIGEKIADSDKGRVAMQDPLSPLTTNTRFFTVDSDAVTKLERAERDVLNTLEINTQSIADSADLKVGDILNLSYYINLGPEISASYEVLRGELKTKSIGTTITRSILKEEDGFVKLKYQEAVVSSQGARLSIEKRFRIALGASVKWRPALYERRSYNGDGESISREITYRIDLKDPVARLAFDDVFRGVIPDWDAGNFEAAVNKGSIQVVTAQKRELVGGKENNRSRRYKFQTGLIDYDRIRQTNQVEETSYCASSVVYLSDLFEPSAQVCEKEIIGATEQRRKLSRRLLYKENEASKSAFRSEIDLNAENGANDVKLIFENIYNDNVTREGEFDYYMQAIRLASGRGRIFKDEQKSQFNQVTGRTSTQLDKSWQYAALSVQMNKSFTDQIFSKSSNDLIQVLSQMYFDGTVTWQNRAALEAWKTANAKKKFDVEAAIFVNFQNLKGLVAKYVRSIDDLKVEKNGNEIYENAMKFIGFFEKLRPMTARDRSIEFSQFVRAERNRTAHLLFILLNLGLGANGDVQNAIDTKALAYTFDFDGRGMPGLVRINDGVRTQIEAQFDFTFGTQIKSTESRIRNSEIRILNDKAYLIFDTQYEASGSGAVEGIFYKFKRFVGDKALGWTISQVPAPLKSQVRGGVDLYSYMIELPSDLLATFKTGKRHTLQFWLEDGAEGRDTETAELMLSLPKN